MSQSSLRKKFKISLFANPQNHLANLFVIQFAKMIKKENHIYPLDVPM